jgi:hypothetical protein
VKRASCLHDGGGYWVDETGAGLTAPVFQEARLWLCALCKLPLPFGQSLNTYTEDLAYRFLEGGGFPSVAFHDGYRNYDCRMQSWVSSSDPAWFARRVADYEAGAFARELERIGWV